MVWILLLGLIASTIMGSTETTLYTIAIYTSAVGIKKIRFVLIASLVGTFVRCFDLCRFLSNFVVIFFLTFFLFWRIIFMVTKLPIKKFSLF